MRVLPEEPPEDLDRRWERLCKRLAARFGKSPSLEGVLFLIGLRELGLGYEPGLEKEAKQDLIQEGANYALAALGYLEPMGREPHTGFTRWRSLRPLDKPLDPDKQERLLRWAAWRYFLACWPDLEEEAG